MNLLLNTVVSFFIYAYLGWCVEVAYVAIKSGKVVNRGFLNGPVCPIYGVGMIGILFALEPIKDNVILLFLGGVVICSVLELFTGWILDQIFHMRWWDYSENPLNIGGYICLEFSIKWGIGSMIMVSMIHPMIQSVVLKIPLVAIYVCLIIFSIVFIVDIIVTIKDIIGFKKSLGQLEKIADGLHNIGDQMKDVVGNSAITVSEKKEEGKDKLVAATAEGREKLAAATAEGREKIAAATAEQKEKLTDAYETGIVELKKQKMELEAKYAAMLLKVQKLGKRQMDAFPKFRVSGSTMSIREKINKLKER